MTSALDNLPTELKLAIVDTLDASSSVDPAVFATRVDGQQSHGTPLKNLSCVSTSWREIAKSKLFLRLVIKLDTAPESPSDGLSAATRLSAALRVSAQATEAFAGLCLAPTLLQRLTLHVDTAAVTAPFYVTGYSYEQQVIDRHRQREFWERVLRVFDPKRLRLHAPPSVLGWLTERPVNMANAWAFPDMAMQILELEQPHDGTVCQVSTNPEPCNPFPTTHHDEDVDYIFRMCPWTIMRLVEGSMLQAYGRYGTQFPCLAYHILNS